MQVSQHYHFEFDHPVDRLWALVSDTARWGEASGMPAYQVTEQLQPDGRVKVFGSTSIAGFDLSWEEPPGNWIAGRWFQQQRLFDRGPMLSMTSSATLHDRGRRSELELELSFETRNYVGTLIARRLVAAYRQTAGELLHTASRLIDSEQPALFETRYEPTPQELARSSQLLETIADSPYEHGLAATLADYIYRAQDVDLWSMRPLAVARQWQASPGAVVELFLQSVRAGLLESRWDILCPRCRIGKSASANISDLPKGVHCDACNIDFEADFASNVELSFMPSASVRPVKNGLYCRSGPGVTPHVKGQCSLAPGASHSLPLALQPGDYRIRTLEAGDELKLNWTRGAFPEIHVDTDSVLVEGESPAQEIRMVNDGELPRTVVIEEQSWLRDVLTAERVTTLQAFRDLFSDQVLRPGDEVSIRNIAFLFSDLVGSASLFNRVGDADAYHLVREHFADLGEIVRRHQGSIVKTVGDGIHAAFLAPDDALRAAIEMQLSMPEFNRRLGRDGISVRIGLHAGPCIAVTLNDRLDYYGEAVNLAARLEGQGDGGEITLSQEFGADHAVDAMLRAYPVRERQVSLKGFEAPYTILQINPQHEHEKAID